VGGVAGVPPPTIIFPSSTGARRSAVGDLRRLVLRPASSAARAPFLTAKGESAAADIVGRVAVRRTSVTP
jgi:hypothetical protein